jgi:hypothetical protein
MDWNPKTRWRRSSEKNDESFFDNFVNPPVRSSRRAGPSGRARSRTESKLRSMKLGISNS